MAKTAKKSRKSLVRRQMRRSLHLESLERRDLFAADAFASVALDELAEEAASALFGTVANQCSANPMDVDGSGTVDATDVSLILERLNVSGEGSDETSGMDVNGDGRLTSLDALQVINELQRQEMATPVLPGATDGSFEAGFHVLGITPGNQDAHPSPFLDPPGSSTGWYLQPIPGLPNQGSVDVVSTAAGFGASLRFDAEGNPVLYAAQDGDKAIDLIGTPNQGALNQVIVTEPGFEYEVTFFVSSNQENQLDGNGRLTAASDRRLQFWWDGRIVDTINAPDMGQWDQHTYRLIASGPTTQFGFLGLVSQGSGAIGGGVVPGTGIVVEQGDPVFGPLLDNVTVRPIRPGPASLQGLAFDDLNGNGVRDTIIVGSEPDIVFTVDTSGSTADKFDGSPVGDLNGDNQADTILDAEIAGLLALNQQLIDRGLGDTAEVSIVSFARDPRILDLDPSTPGRQISTTPLADRDGNGVPDLEQAVVNLVSSGGTYFEDALNETLLVFSSLGTSFENGNLIFLSDGRPEPATQDFKEGQLKLIKEKVANVRAFGVGDKAELPELLRLDPNAIRFKSTDELLDVFSGIGSGVDNFLEPGMADVQVYLDLNDNGILDSGEPRTLTLADDPGTPINETGQYSFSDLAPGTYVVREIVPSEFVQTAPTGDGAHRVGLRAAETREGLDFGNHRVDPPAQPDPEIVISDVSVAEGDSGFTIVAIPITLSEAGAYPVSVQYEVSNGSALAGEDFVGGSSTVVLAAGQTSSTIQLHVYGDVNVEPSEEFFVHLTASDGAIIADDAAKVTIDNDDSSLLVDRVGAVRGNEWHLDKAGDGYYGESKFRYGPSNSVPLVGDFNGDRFDDIAFVVENHQQGTLDWFIDYHGNGKYYDRVLAFGLLGDEPVVGDWNGDGKDDLGVVRQNAQRGGLDWYFDTTGDGGIADEIRQFGLLGDTPVAGDWDGDGKDDVGIVRENPNRAGLDWFFDKLGDGQFAEEIKHYGLLGDRPVVGDWDGDGTDDMGVIRQSQTSQGYEWWLDLAGDGLFAEKIIHYGVVGDKPIVGNWRN